MKAAIVGIEGPELTAAEAALLQANPPAGVILFSRNIKGLMPLARLVGDLREVLPPECLMVVDHEGGRVARLAPPDWRPHPAAGAIGANYPDHAPACTRLAWLTGALIGLDCADAGFDVVCAPVLDVLGPGATAAIGDRSYGSDPETVVALAQSTADGLLSAGVQPVGKHAPGHGRARVDSHVGLPRLAADEDLAAEIAVFAACSSLPWMMTAHIVYEGLDPDRPGTLSPIVIEGVIRGTIGFDGVLVSDDLAMGALTGPPDELARAALAAGCDIAMHCSGVLADTRAVLEGVPSLSRLGEDRLARAQALADRSRLQLDRMVLIADQDALTGMVDVLLQIALAAIPVILAITLHEAAHGYAALALGDDTARRMGRLSLNPLRHIDRFGTILLPGGLMLAQLLAFGKVGFLFGWAKPVPVSAWRFRNPRQGMALVAAAGPAANFTLAWIGALGLHLLPLLSDAAGELLDDVLQTFIVANLVLGLFNLLPIPPLDGGRIAIGVLPPAMAARWAGLERGGILIVILLVFIAPRLLAELGVHFDPVGAALGEILPGAFALVCRLAGIDV